MYNIKHAVKKQQQYEVITLRFKYIPQQWNFQSTKQSSAINTHHVAIFVNIYAPVLEAPHNHHVDLQIMLFHNHVFSNGIRHPLTVLLFRFSSIYIVCIHIIAIYSSVIIAFP